MTARQVPPSTDRFAPDTSMSVVGSELLSNRLAVVSECVTRLKRKAKADQVQPQDVHLLRVGVRRASAAIAVIELLPLEKVRFRKLKRRLRKLRRALGVARSADVALEILSHEKAAGNEALHPALDRLTKALRRRRRAALHDLEELLARYRSERIERWSRRARAVLQRSFAAESRFGDVASSSLRALLQPVLATLDEEYTSIERMHELRLAGKRLRYATEFFAEVLDPVLLENATVIMVKLQDRLGAINDLHEIIKLIESHDLSLLDAEKPGMHQLRRLFTDRFAALMDEFQMWWTQSGHRELDQIYKALLDNISSSPIHLNADASPSSNRGSILHNGSPAA